MKRKLSTILSIIAMFDYMETLEEMAEWSEQAEKTESDLSGDDLEEYLATSLRIIEKLTLLSCDNKADD